MVFHVVFAGPIDLVAIAAGARRGSNPQHANGALAEALDATIHDGTGLRASLADHVRAKLLGMSPLGWTIARHVRRTIAPGDVIFCTGEDVGLPVAALCGDRARVAIMVHNLDRVRGRLALRVLRIGRRAALLFAVAQPQVAFLRQFLGLPERRVLFLADQTDLAFFTPGPADGTKVRPVIASVGLEQRDYRTLATATADLDVDVRISGYSRDATALARAFPAMLPANMDQRFYAWPDLVQLYRDADVVVVSVAPNRYAAGIQVMLEAMACARPVLITRTEGLAGYLVGSAPLYQVPPGDPAAMRAAIEQLLSDPVAAEAQGRAACDYAHQFYGALRYIEAIATALRALAEAGTVTPP